MASLVLLKTPDGSATGEKIQLNNQHVVLIGRSPERCKVVLPVNAVSREHAEIKFNQGQFFLTDLKSRNQTFLNNKVIAPNTPMPLKDGDGIKICDFLFCFRDETKPTVSPALKLPDNLKKSGDPAEEEESNSTTIQAALQRAPSQQFLDVQPLDKLRVLLKISAALSKSLDVDKVLTQIADEMFDLFRQADRCFIIQVNDAGQYVPSVTRTRRGGDADRFSRTIVRKCLESLQSFLSEDATSDTNVSAAQSIAEFRIRSVMCVPLASGDSKPFGVMQLDSQDRTKKFTQEDLKLLVCVANQASIALENARLHEELVKRVKLDEENKAATRVQLALLPQNTPRVEGYEFFARYLPARTVGGDYYDFISLPGGRHSVLLGDVSGKGVPAALIVARVSGEARVSIITKPCISEAVTHLNDLFFQANFEDRFLTLAATVLDPEKHQVTFVNAGHVPPWIYRQATRSLEKPVPYAVSGYAIGQVPEFGYESITIDLQPGDVVILCTDGIMDAEASDGRRFTEQGVIRSLKLEEQGVVLTAGQIGKRIIEAVTAHAANHPQFDDIALVCYGRVDHAGSVSYSGSDEMELV